MKKYPETSNLNLPDIAEKVLADWDKNKIFEKSVSSREGAEPFVFYEGPPSANGLPGIHHVMARAMKDIFCRYQTLKGKQVKRKAGWDTHGLPIELSVEKTLGITKEDIGKKISIEDYNLACRTEVMKYTHVWEDVTKKMGYWVDMSDPYITYENSYIESVWWLLQNLYKKELMYKGYTIQPYSPAAGTGLSSHEINQPGCYRAVKDRTATAMFKINWNNFENLNIHQASIHTIESINNIPTYFLAWTTTPWTLPSNMALAIGEKITYALVKTFNPFSHQLISIILAKDLLMKFFSEGIALEKEVAQAKEKTFLKTWISTNEDFESYKPGDKKIPWKILLEFNGVDLIGLKYEQLLPYFPIENSEVAFRVIPGDFVSTEDGTGIVHIAPTFGADDKRAADKAKIAAMLVPNEKGAPVPLVDLRGRFRPEVVDFAGEYVKTDYLSDVEKTTEIERLKTLSGSPLNDLIAKIVNRTKEYLSVDERIILKLELEGTLFKKETYEHNYPHCWRTDKPILYYPLDSWFIKASSMKERMAELNKTINWKPESTGTGRFGEWLNNLQDWNLSRSRYWGTPLPIWREPFSSMTVCVGSFNEFQLECEYDEKNWGRKIVGKWYFKGDRYKNLEAEILNRNSKIIYELQIFYNTTLENPHKHVEEILKLAQQNADNILWNIKSEFLIPYLDSIPQELDFHKPFVDNIIFIGDVGEKDKRVFVRELEVIDVWFDSGSMPYAQLHYPFENKELIDQRKYFPADFIAEGVDQTRGWFYTLHAIATMCFDSVAYKNVISNGLVLDKNGNKMSKRLGNGVDPFETLKKYGPDATRWYMVTNASPWDNLKFDTEGIVQAQRGFLGTLYNTYGFFSLYANIDDFEFDENNLVPVSERTELDRWLISRLNSLVKFVTEKLDDYDPTPAARAIEDFVDLHLSNWYVRLSRRRFWKGEMTRDKQAAYETLYECLDTVSQLMSPFAPFFAEWLYANLKRGAKNKSEKPESIHLTLLRKANEKLIDKELEERMELAENFSSLVLSLRKKVNIRVRQPLSKIMIPVLDKQFQGRLELVKDLILAETNVKSLEYVTESGVFVKKIKPDFKLLGKKLGKHMKAAAAAFSAFSQADISKMELEGSFDLNLEGETINIERAEVEILVDDLPGMLMAIDGKYTVALDITLTPELREEGLARELVNRIQNLRKDKDFEVTDRIDVKIKSQEALATAVRNNFNYICSETLATTLELVNDILEKEAVTVEVDDEIKTLVHITKHN